MNILTVLEIFTNPYDLEISIGRENKDSGKYALFISRGPGHNFKLMLNSIPFAETTEEVVQEIKKILEIVVKAAVKEFQERASVLSLYLNPDGETIDQSKVLTAELIIRILEELRTRQVASTYKMHA